MLTEETIEKINKEIQSELRWLSVAFSDEDRQSHLDTIKELKAILDEDEDTDPSDEEELVIALDELFDAVRALFRRKKRINS